MSSSRYRALAIVLGILTLLATLTSLAGCDLSGSTASAATATASPGLDAQSQAYIAVLKAYLSPVDLDFDNQVIGCTPEHLSSNLEALQQCQQGQVTFGNDTRALGAHLTVVPPPRWQTEDAVFKQAVQADIPLTAQGAIAKSTDELSAIIAKEKSAEAPVCVAVGKIDTDLLLAKQISDEPAGVASNYDSCTY